MRHSVEKAAWSLKREEDYEQMARELASRLGASLRQQAAEIFLVTDSTEKLLVRASQPKRAWYEAWLALRPYPPA